MKILLLVPLVLIVVLLIRAWRTWRWLHSDITPFDTKTVQWRRWVVDKDRS